MDRTRTGVGVTQKKMKDMSSFQAGKEERGWINRHTEEEKKKLKEVTAGILIVNFITAVGIKIRGRELRTRSRQHQCLRKSLKHPLCYLCSEINCENQQWMHNATTTRALKFNSLIPRSPNQQYSVAKKQKERKHGPSTVLSWAQQGMG